MTLPYRCPWCRETSDTADRFLNHLFAWHMRLLRERLAMYEARSTRKPPDPPRNALNPRPPLNPGVSGEGDST